MENIDEKDKKKIIDIATALFPKAKIYFFGSRARGTHSNGSDIDIAIDMGEKQRRADIGELRDMLEVSNIPFKIDVVDLHGINERMKEIILKEGILWKH